MVIIDPVTLGDVAANREGAATFFDKNGVLQSAPPNTLRVTYDPSDLTKPPYAFVEPAATNSVNNNTMQGAVAGTPGTLPTNWQESGVGTLVRQIVGVGSEAGIPYIDVRYSGVASTTAMAVYTTASSAVPAAKGQTWAAAYFIRLVGGTADAAFSLRVRGNNSAGSSIETGNTSFTPVAGELATSRITSVYTLSLDTVASVLSGIFVSTVIGKSYDFTLRIGAPQLERDRVTNPILNNGTVGTRPADVIGPGAGLVYSNVAITEPNYNASTTYALNDIVHDPATHLTYKSLIASNLNKPLTDKNSWLELNATNRWLMFDQYNNTQTSSAEEIVVVLSPVAIAQGAYLGNVDASEVCISVTDLTEGVVSQEKQSLLVSESASSYFNWSFKRFKNKTYAVSVKMPPYANSLITITIKKPGGIAKCGVCVVGPITDIGITQMGLGREIKDYSTTNFNFDGTSKTSLRGFAKRMDLDVVINNDQIDAVIASLENFRQKPVAWIATDRYGSACVFGRYSSFKNVISEWPISKMSLQIEGTV